MGVAGSVAIAVVNLGYEVKLPVDVETLEDDEGNLGAVTLEAKQNNNVEVVAGAGTNEAGVGGGTGVGASFALLTANIKSVAAVEDVTVLCGDLTVEAEAVNALTAESITGAKGEEEATEEEKTEGEATEPATEGTETTEPAEPSEEEEEKQNKIGRAHV